MKIKSQADVEKLDKRIKAELGIDVRKYRDEEVAENFMEVSFKNRISNRNHFSNHLLLFDLVITLVPFSIFFISK